MDDRTPLLRKLPLVVRCQFSDESVAVIQWLADRYEDPLEREQIQVVSINTCWGSPEWAGRTEVGLAWIESLGFKAVSLNAEISFEEAVLARGQFPTVKNQWCASLLKGMPLLNWLNRIDLMNACTVVIAKRQARQVSPVFEFIDECPFHGDRAVWHPLFNFSNAQVQDLLDRTPFRFSSYKVSEECYPCVRHLKLTAQHMSVKTRIRVNELEAKISTSIWGNQQLEKIGRYQLGFLSSIETKSLEHSEESGCSAPFGCGL